MTASRLLRRADAARVLSENGFPTAKSTLDSLATRGGGPAFQLYGRIPLYAEDDVLAWARARLSRKITSTSELDAA
jgi:hypothetical protein